MNSQEILVIEPTKALDVFKEPKGLDPYLAKIRAEIDSFVPDVNTKKGRDAIASIAHKVAKSKTYLDGIGKDLVAELKEIPKKIDEHRRIMRETLDAWKEEVRLPLTEWETAEEARINHMKENLDYIKRQLPTEAYIIDSMSLVDIRQAISKIGSTIIDDSWQEFKAEASILKDATLSGLKNLLVSREKYLAEQAELAELRRQKEEREAKELQEAEARAQIERDEKIRQEAAQKAIQEAKAKADAERKAEADRVAQEQERLENERLAAIQEAEAQKIAAERAERQRLQAEEDAKQAAIAAEERHKREIAEAEAKVKREAEIIRLSELAAQENRERNKRHAAKINNEALQALISNGIPEAEAKLVVTLIAQKKIPNIQINY